MDEHALYKQVDANINAFSGPIDSLDQVLRSIPNEDLQIASLRLLGEVMGNLDAIAYEFRKHLGTTSL